MPSAAAGGRQRCPALAAAHAAVAVTARAPRTASGAPRSLAAASTVHSAGSAGAAVPASACSRTSTWSPTASRTRSVSRCASGGSAAAPSVWKDAACAASHEPAVQGPPGEATAVRGVGRLSRRRDRWRHASAASAPIAGRPTPLDASAASEASAETSPSKHPGATHSTVSARELSLTPCASPRPSSLLGLRCRTTSTCPGSPAPDCDPTAWLCVPSNSSPRPPALPPPLLPRSPPSPSSCAANAVTIG